LLQSNSMYNFGCFEKKSYICTKIRIENEQTSGRLLYQRFSPQKQHSCAAGGTTDVIASLLAGAETGSNSQDSQALSDYQRECQLPPLTFTSMTCMTKM